MVAGRKERTPWTVVAQGTRITYEQASLVDQLTKVSDHPDELTVFLQSSAQPSIEGLFALFQHLNGVDDLIELIHILQSVLAVYPVCIMNHIRKSPDLVAPLLKCLSVNDPTLELQDYAAIIIGKLLNQMLKESAGFDSETTVSALDTQTDQFFAWTNSALADPDIPELHCVHVLQALGEILRTDRARWRFCQGTKAVMTVARLVDEELHHQVQALYQAVFVLWLLSFANEGKTADAVSLAVDEASVPRRLSLLLREVTAEKVVRVCVSTLSNLVRPRFSPRLRREMVGAGIIRTVEQLCVRKWADTDILNDMMSLSESLQDEKKLMSSFEVYHHEVLSGALQWTHVHSDDGFWRDNVEKMDRNNMEVLRCLVRLLNQSSDPVVLSVACNDLAMFIKYHPRGRYIAQSLGVKTRLMQLMTSESADVRRHALNCIQVLMITHWDMVQKIN